MSAQFVPVPDVGCPGDRNALPRNAIQSPPERLYKLSLGTIFSRRRSHEASNSICAAHR